jgi:hypothetical protein
VTALLIGLVLVVALVFVLQWRGIDSAAAT